MQVPLCVCSLFSSTLWGLHTTRSQSSPATADDISIISRACRDLSFLRCMFERLRWFDLMLKVSCTLGETENCVVESEDWRVVNGEWWLQTYVESLRACLSHLHVHTYVDMYLFIYLLCTVCNRQSACLCELTPHLWCWNINAQSWLLMSFWFMSLFAQLCPRTMRISSRR